MDSENDSVSLARVRVASEMAFLRRKVARDAYGFSKYICAQHIERADRIVNLRLFAVFGAYEDYTVRFISNACCRALKRIADCDPAGCCV